MANVKIDIDDRTVVDALNRLLEIGESPAPALNAVGRLLKTRIQQGFETSTDPLGRPWAPLKSRQGQPLVDKGHLRNSIDYNVEGNSVVVGTSMPYAPVHQFGAVIEPKRKKALSFFVEGRKVVVKRVTIPERPFLPEEQLPQEWGDAALDEIADVIRDAIAAAKR